MTTSNTSSRGNRRTILIAAGALVALVIVAIIIAVASGGDDDDNTAADTAIATSDADSGADTAADPSVATDNPARIPGTDTAQVSAVSTTGALPRFDPDVPVDPAVGQDAPTVTASYFDDTEVTIGFDDGTPRVLLFLAHWCSHCQAEVPRLNEWMTANGIPDDVEIVPISTAVDSGAPNYPPAAWLLDEGWPVPTLRDSQLSELASAFGLSGFPFIVVTDGDGKIVARNSGEVDATQWEAFLAAAVAA